MYIPHVAFVKSHVQISVFAFGVTTASRPSLLIVSMDAHYIDYTASSNLV